MKTWYQRIPKVELHVHLEGAIPHGALLDLIRKYGGAPEIRDEKELAARFRYKDFPHFIEMWNWKNRFLREYDDFTHIAELVAHDMAEQTIRYAEMFFSPSTFTGRGLGIQDLTCAIRRGLSRVPEIQIALIADLVRDYGPENEMDTLKVLAEVRDQGVIGIGIGGSEHQFPPALFRSLFEQARRLGFHTTAHAGEAAGPDSIWSAIKDLRVDRIGHGTRAIEDPELVDYLAKHQIPLELCPMSNVRTGVVDSIRRHPVRSYFDRGLLISINTDDPAMFGTALDQEYRLLEQECGFSGNEICEVIRRSVQSSWLPTEQKTSLMDKFEANPEWVKQPG
ncbi:adenosine deaminase [bacterium]|nr:adenosine deaminase [candidate division CSSED10-310 bacterium]